MSRVMYLAIEAIPHFSPQERKDASFIAGRAAAQHALKQYGIQTEVKKSATGAPIWPKGYSGSITHSENFAAALVSKTSLYESLGIDLEDSNEQATRVFKKIATKSEKDLFEQSTNITKELFPTVIFSAKESFYKALNGLIKTPLRFQDLSLEAKKTNVQFIQAFNFSAIGSNIEYIAINFSSSALLQEAITKFKITLESVIIDQKTIVTITTVQLKNKQ